MALLSVGQLGWVGGVLVGVGRVAFATCAGRPDGHVDDHAAAGLLGAEFRVWSDPTVDWESYDRVVVRSTWDYSQRRDEFLAWAQRVGERRLRNAPALIEANSDKRYLSWLAAPTVSTTFVAPGDPVPSLPDQVVVKPTVSAGARDTGRFGPSLHADAYALITAINDSGRTAMVQPYLDGVDQDGETALVFLGGELSHVLHKKPVLKPDEIAPLATELGDFAPAAAMTDPDLVTPGAATEAQVSLATRVLTQLTREFGTPTYVRVDLVPGPDNSPVVIEVEAVEPCLYLDLTLGAAARLATAVHRS